MPDTRRQVRYTRPRAAVTYEVFTPSQECKPAGCVSPAAVQEGVHYRFLATRLFQVY